MIVTRRRTKKPGLGRFVLPLLAIAALAGALWWPPSHNVIVNGHGGALSFLSQTGHGTTFLVRLPIECRTAEFRGEAA